MCFKLLFLEAKREISLRRTDLPIFGHEERVAWWRVVGARTLVSYETKTYPIVVYSWSPGREATGIRQMDSLARRWEAVLE